MLLISEILKKCSIDFGRSSSVEILLVAEYFCSGYAFGTGGIITNGPRNPLRDKLEVRLI